MSATRIDVHHARARSASGQALLVCAYDEAEKCRNNDLADSITLTEFRGRPVDVREEIILYCA